MRSTWNWQAGKLSVPLCFRGERYWLRRLLFPRATTSINEASPLRLCEHRIASTIFGQAETGTSKMITFRYVTFLWRVNSIGLSWLFGAISIAYTRLFNRRTYCRMMTVFTLEHLTFHQPPSLTAQLFFFRQSRVLLQPKNLLLFKFFLLYSQ